VSFSTLSYPMALEDGQEAGGGGNEHGGWKERQQTGRPREVKTEGWRLKGPRTNKERGGMSPHRGLSFSQRQHGDQVVCPKMGYHLQGGNQPGNQSRRRGPWARSSAPFEG
jgi:hypothetical protein